MKFVKGNPAYNARMNIRSLDCKSKDPHMNDSQKNKRIRHMNLLTLRRNKLEAANKKNKPLLANSVEVDNTTTNTANTQASVVSQTAVHENESQQNELAQ
jgi:hypothetical protein